MPHGDWVAFTEQLSAVSKALDESDAWLKERFGSIEASVNDLMRRTGRPGGDWTNTDAASERTDAIGLCRTRKALLTPKLDAGEHGDYTPGSTEIDEALTACRGLKQLYRRCDMARLEPQFQKSPSAFSFGGNGGVLLPPQTSSQILRCLVDPTDMAGMVSNVAISSGSIQFPIDNVRTALAGWGCDAACVANNPQPDLSGMEMLEIKAEPIRFVLCATPDLLQDAAFNIENWLMEKVARGFRDTLSEAIVIGDGLGKPLGFMNPQAGVPICETSDATPAGRVTWQDLVSLKFELPVQWHSEGRYYMNQRTAALLFTMSGADSRPLFSILPEGQPGFMLCGSPLVICSWFPDVMPGSTPIMYGNLKQLYTLVNRRALTLLVDPYSAGWCTLFKWDARVGRNCTCPNAARLLRVR